MAHDYIERTLWCEGPNGRTDLPQVDLRKRTEPLVILGEAGMGKSRLLEWLSDASGYAHCTARRLINRHDPRTLLGDAQVLVIDALDEVSAQQEGDAVDLVLRQLGRLGYPRFVLSCRVADWRSATGVEAISEQYPEPPLELQLKPFDDDDAVAFLQAQFGDETARAVVGHFNKHGLSGLLGNPQTLNLIAAVARAGDLPKTRSELFEHAIEVLRREHRDSKADVQVARDVGLAAAGAASAGLILTGSEAIVRAAVANAAEGELQLEEIALLPKGDAIRAMLGTRLFKADGADRFSYSHRRLGEYLGARWLAKLADTSRKRRRLLSIFHNFGLVPASLRGIHAWLARDPNLAQSVIAADPMGVIEYGDADDLTVDQARTLLSALGELAKKTPHFRDWGPYSARGIARPELLEDVRGLITAPETPVGLRLLVLQAIKGAAITQDLADEIRILVLDRKAHYATRSAAGEALTELVGDEEWPAILRSLLGYGDGHSIRLAIELMTDIGYGPFDDTLIVDLAVAYATANGVVVGLLRFLGRQIPESRVEGVLDRLADAVQRVGSRHERPGNDVLTDLAYCLIVRRVATGGVSAAKLWGWLEPFAETTGYERDTRDHLKALLVNDNSLRWAVQRLVLLEGSWAGGMFRGAWALTDRSSALTPTDADILALLETLDPADHSDERWRDLILLAHHDGDSGAEVRAGARPFAAHRTDLLKWLEKLANPVAPEWQRRRAMREQKQRARQATERAEQRRHFAALAESMRAGNSGPLVGPAMAYLKLLDMGEGVPAHERISQWLGQRTAEAAHLGFEAFLVQEPPKPTAAEIAASLAEGRYWEAGYIIVAAFAERLRKGVGFGDLPDERLMAGLFELRRSRIDRHAGIEGLEEAIDAEIEKRGIWTDAMRRYHEPQLQARCERIDGLTALMHDDFHAATSTELAAEWLERFQGISIRTELELIDRLFRSGRIVELRRAAASRAGLTDDERRRNWDAIGLILDFEQTAARLKGSRIERDLLWNMRSYTVGRSGDRTSVTLGPAQLEWIIATFRPLWPMVARPRGVTTGDTNAWDASDCVVQLIRRLGNDFSDDAVAALERLRDAEADGYSETISIVVAEQARIRVEALYVPPTLDAVRAVARDEPPRVAADLQALMIEELSIVQAKIKSDDAESWRGFWDERGEPFAEERCRDHLLGLLRQGSEGITLDPETHVAGDKEVDIACSVEAIRMPIEIKCQWHPKLWQGLDSQLDRLYAQDWRADGRGIYVVLWFGNQRQSKRQLASPGRGATRPETPEELQQMLSAGSSAAREGRIRVFVLDLAR